MANNLTLSGASFNASGKFGSSLSAGYGATSGNVGPASGNQTVELWVKKSSTGLAVAYLNGGMWIGTDNTNAHARYNTASGEQQLTTSVSVTDGAWHHLSFNVGTAGASLYVDGVLCASNAIASNAGGGAINVGSYGGGSYAWGGEIDDVALYSGILRTANFAAPTAAVSNSAANLLALYHLDGDGTDSTGAAQATPTATAVTLSGPTSGTVSVASSAFSVGVSPTGGTITGTVVVTPSDGGAGGAFSPTSVSLTTASPSGTFTYTPSTTGSRTISASNNGSLTNPTSITYTSNSAASAPVTVPVTDANVFFSPYNWYSDGAGAQQANNINANSSFAWTWNAGAYIKLRVNVTTSGNAYLNVDTTSLNSISGPTIAWSTDKTNWSTSTLAYSASQVQINLGSLAVGAHDILIVQKDEPEGPDRWNTPLCIVKVTGFQFPTGTTTQAPTLFTGRMVCFGDSITQARSAGTDGNDDSRYGYALLLGRALNCEVGVIGASGSGYGSGGQGNVPAFYNADLTQASWSNYMAGKSRLVAGKLSPQPDIVTCNHGRNNSGMTTAQVTGWLAQARAAAPNAKLYIVTTFDGTERDLLLAASLPDANSYFIDMGINNEINGQWGNFHPSGLGHANLAGMIVAKMKSATPILTARTVTLTLTDRNGSARANLSGLKWAFFDANQPHQVGAPYTQGNSATTNASGVLSLSVNTSLASGATGWLVISDSTGSASAASNAFSGPVTVS